MLTHLTTSNGKQHIYLIWTMPSGNIVLISQPKLLVEEHRLMVRDFLAGTWLTVVFC